MQPTAALDSVRFGDVLAGKYRIEALIGTGGMGIVLAARHLQLEEKVAIKFLLPDALANREAVARFAREARAAVRIKSEHVARVIDVGALENGAPYMVMEFLDGVDLAVWLHQHGPLAVDQVAEFVLQTCEALAEAHALGIIHRDLKPANLFCIRQPDGLLSVKVLDFGISKLTTNGAYGAGMAITKTTEVMGSPFYMSPEQVRCSRDVDARTDIWALGVILYELLTGMLPFRGESIPGLVVKITTACPQSMRQLRPGLPEGVEAIVMKCLQKARTDRYRNVAELAMVLAPYAPKRTAVVVERISRIVEAAGLCATAAMTEAIAPAWHVIPNTPTAGSWVQTKPTVPPQHNAPLRVVAITSFLALLVVVGVFISPWRQLSISKKTSTSAATTTASEAKIAREARPSPPGQSADTVSSPPLVAFPRPSAGAPSDRTSPGMAAPTPTKTRLGHAKHTATPVPTPMEAAVPTASASPTTPSPPTPVCDVPYTIDGVGHRQYKPECLK